MQTINGAPKNKDVQCDKIIKEDKGIYILFSLINYYIWIYILWVCWLTNKCWNIQSKDRNNLAKSQLWLGLLWSATFRSWQISYQVINTDIENLNNIIINLDLYINYIIELCTLEMFMKHL